MRPRLAAGRGRPYLTFVLREAKGKVFAWLETPTHFAALRVDEYGHSISWTNAAGYVVDLSADSLRRDAERQAEVHRLMVG